MASVGELPAMFAKVIAPRAAARIRQSPTTRTRKELESVWSVCTRFTMTVRSDVGEGADRSSGGCLMTTCFIDSGGDAGDCSVIALLPSLNCSLIEL